MIGATIEFLPLNLKTNIMNPSKIGHRSICKKIETVERPVSSQPCPHMCIKYQRMHIRTT